MAEQDIHGRDPSKSSPKQHQGQASRVESAHKGAEILRSLLEPDPQLLDQAGREMITGLHEGYRLYTGQGLGDSTSHRNEGRLGNRMVSGPIELPAYYDAFLHQGSQILVEQLATEPDVETIERINSVFAHSLAEQGITDDALFTPETILEVKRAATENGHPTYWCDYMPIPVRFDGQGRMTPVTVADEDNRWQKMQELIEGGEVQIAFLMMEGQASFAGYFGFGHRYLEHGAFDSDHHAIETFRREVARQVYGGHSDFTVVDYKIRERMGEVHHLPGDKFTIAKVWGSGHAPVDPRDIVVTLKSGALEGVRLMNTCTPREYGIVLDEVGPEQARELKAILNDTDRWLEHPVAMCLVNKGLMPAAYRANGQPSMMIPSFSSVVELRDSLHFEPQYIVSKPAGGDSGYGIEIGTPDEVEARTKGRSHQVVQPLVDILRPVPNALKNGPLAKGGALELRSVPIRGYGMTRIGAHEPFRPGKGMTMVHQEYIMGEMRGIVAAIQQQDGVSQAEAWRRMLLLSNAGFGMFKVKQ